MVVDTSMSCCVIVTLVIIGFQALDLKPHQVEWVTNHLGHSLDVHKLHYRMTSGNLERMQVAKLLLLQDTAQVNRFANKTLNDIDLTGRHKTKSKLDSETLPLDHNTATHGISEHVLRPLPLSLFQISCFLCLNKTGNNNHHQM